MNGNKIPNCHFFVKKITCTLCTRNICKLSKITILGFIMRLFAFLFLPFVLLHSQSVDSLIAYSLKKHNSLRSIQHRLNATKHKIAISKNWANPDLSLTISDIQFRNPFSRSEERMQYHAINIKQKFPWFGKLSARKELEERKKDSIIYSLEAARVVLAYNIRTTAYTVKELEARIKVLNKYRKLTKQNIELYTDYMSTDSMSHASSIDAELTLSKIEIRAERYISILKAQKEKLRYLVQKKVRSISTKLHIRKPKSLRYYLKGLRKNPLYHQKLSKTYIAKSEKKLRDLEIHPDPYVKVGYFNRPDYADYTTVSVGISIPVWGTEKHNIEIAKKELLATKMEALDYKENLKSQIRMNYAKLTEAYRIYRIIQYKSLPELQHLLDLSATAIEEGSDLLTYTQVLEEKLRLEEERIAIVAEFMRTQAKLKSLTGVK